MSLVVAQTTEDGPCIVSDTRTTWPDERRPSFKSGTLKAIVVTREVTVCFAGNVKVGLDGVRQFAKRLKAGESLKDLLLSLQQLTSDAESSAEFIVASAEPNSMLTRIRNGEIEQNLSSAWIGDQRGFERFQEERHKPVERFLLNMRDALPVGARVMLSLSQAMEAVIADPTIDLVNDFCVRVTAKGGEFNYLSQVFVHAGRDIAIKSGDNLLSKMVQPVADGGYAVSVVEPAEPGTAALGLNFPRARMGMIYLPLEHEEAQVINDVSPNDFAKVILDRFSVVMKDPMIRYAKRIHPL